MMCVVANMPAVATTVSASNETGNGNRSSTTAASSASTASKEPNNNEETLPPPPPDDATTTVEDHLHHHRVGNTVNSQSSDSDLGSTDEVKVFNDEDEPDAGDLVSESCYQAELQAEKSSLIHESEQVRTTPTCSDKDLIFRPEELGSAAFAAVPGMASFGMAAAAASYFVNPYAAYAATNGSHVSCNPRSSSGSPLSQYLYGAGGAAPGPPGPSHVNAAGGGSGPPSDPLVASPPPPPPAHVGLRSPLYSLSHTQYPYSMLGAADQLAAWHHQASVYHQTGALRPNSPYSLPPITSATFSSSMFSPSSLLGSNGSSQHQTGHLPHIKPGDFDTSACVTSSVSPAGGGGTAILNVGSRKESRQSKKNETHIKKPLNAFMLYMKEMRPVVQAECTLKESAAINQLLGRRWHGLSREEQAKYYEKARVERQKHMQMYPHWNARDNYRFGSKKKKRKRERSVEIASASSSNHSNNSLKKCRARYGLDQHNMWCKPCRRKKKCIRVVQAQTLLQHQTNQHHHHHHHQRPAGVQDLSTEEEEELEDNNKNADGSKSEAACSPWGLSSSPLSASGSVPSPMVPSPTWFSGYHGHVKPKPSSSRSLDPRDAKHPLSICQLTGNSSLNSREDAAAATTLAAAICAANAVANSAALFGLR